jgi:endonuclease III
LVKLPELLDALETLHGKPPPPYPYPADPVELILYENVAYLVDEPQRRRAFEALRARVGVEPACILSAPADALADVVKLGGAFPQQRIEKLRKVDRLLVDQFKGDLRPVLALPLAQAKKKLQLFPGIGEPGAEKILLFARAHPILALESNGLRVLLRLGFGEEKRNYAASYKSAQQAAAAQVPADCDTLIRAHQLLRRHGQEICKRSAPRCMACPLDSVCPKNGVG